MKRNKWVTKEKNIKYLFKSYSLEKVTLSKLRFSKFKKFVTRLIFGELQLTQMSLNPESSCCNLKNQRPGIKTVFDFTIILVLKVIMKF